MEGGPEVLNSAWLVREYRYRPFFALRVENYKKEAISTSESLAAKQHRGPVDVQG